MFSFLLQVSFWANLIFVQAQYYQQPELNLYDSASSSSSSSSNSDASLDDFVEQKYVNSGQSIILICDLPNSMPDGKVIFIKYDNKVLSSGSAIREDSDDERFEIGQQYAWEWSLKINSINEDDSGLYFCKVGNVIIKKFEIIVRVPPRIKDDLMPIKKKVREGESVEFACFASGTPKPNITWYIFNHVEQNFRPLSHTGNHLKVDNVNRYSPRRYQCRASNNIPPSDTRNLTFSVEFAPEIEIQSKLDINQNLMTLNCTINAYPLTNTNFWRKDGNFIQKDMKRQIKNLKIDETTYVSQLTIKNYNEADQGLYECTAENDLRVSKIVYNLKENYDLINNKPPVVLMPIGSTNTFRDKSIKLAAQNEADSNDFSLLDKQDHKSEQQKIPKQFRTKAGSNNHHVHHQQKQHQFKNENDEPSASSASILNAFESNRVKSNQRKQHQRNHKNFSKSMNINLVDKLIYASHSTVKSSTSNYANSPYIILINDDSLNSDDYNPSQNSDDLSASARYTTRKSLVALEKIENSSVNLHCRVRNLVFSYFFICFTLAINYYGKFSS